MEGGVEREELRRRELGGVHGVEQALCGRQVGGRRRVGEVARDGRLEDEPGAHDVGDGEAACSHLQAHERAHAAAGGRDDDGAGARARAGLRADEAEHLEHAQRFAHARAADAQLGGEGPLAGETVAGGQPSVEEVGLDVLEHGLPGAGRIGCRSGAGCHVRSSRRADVV